jgi:DNA transformation protein and related proteins
MAINPVFRDFVLDQLRRVLPSVRSRSMFGGIGIYSEELFFALIDDETLYLKVNDTNRGDFEARGLGPFRPFGDSGEVMQYYELAPDLLEDPDTLRPWAEKAVLVARQAKARKRPRKT